MSPLPGSTVAASSPSLTSDSTYREPPLRLPFVRPGTLMARPSGCRYGPSWLAQLMHISRTAPRSGQRGRSGLPPGFGRLPEVAKYTSSCLEAYRISCPTSYPQGGPSPDQRPSARSRGGMAAASIRPPGLPAVCSGSSCPWRSPGSGAQAAPGSAAASAG